MKQLATNNSVINFKKEDYLGHPIDLGNYKGQKVFISFFRGASCPFCNMRLRDLIKQHQEFEQKGIKIITFFASSTEEILKYAGKQKTPFPIIPDQKFEVYQKYGIEKSTKGMFKAMMNPIKMIKMMISGFFNLKSMKDEPIIPADFLINENQTIFKAHYGKDFGDHLSIDEILSWEDKKILR